MFTKNDCWLVNILNARDWSKNNANKLDNTISGHDFLFHEMNARVIHKWSEYCCYSIHSFRGKYLSRPNIDIEVDIPPSIWKYI